LWHLGTARCLTDHMGCSRSCMITVVPRSETDTQHACRLTGGSSAACRPIAERHVPSAPRIIGLKSTRESSFSTVGRRVLPFQFIVNPPLFLSDFFACGLIAEPLIGSLVTVAQPCSKVQPCVQGMGDSACYFCWSATVAWHVLQLSQLSQLMHRPGTRHANQGTSDLPWGLAAARNAPAAQTGCGCHSSDCHLRCCCCHTCWCPYPACSTAAAAAAAADHSLLLAEAPSLVQPGLRSQGL
jgi:hypothetical protein